jgi:hypothetical protein
MSHSKTAKRAKPARGKDRAERDYGQSFTIPDNPPPHPQRERCGSPWVRLPARAPPEVRRIARDALHALVG